MQLGPKITQAMLGLCMLQLINPAPGWCDPAPAKSAEPAAAAGAVAAQAGQFGQRYGSHLEPILTRISATPEQRKTITLILTTYKPKIEPLRQEYRVKSQEFLDYIVQGKPADMVMARQGELNHLYTAIVTQYGMMRIEIRKQLTDTQCVKFEEYRRKQGWTSQK